MPYYYLATTTALPYSLVMQTVCETPSFLASAKAEGMTDAEREAAVSQIAEHPADGAVIIGSGGCRKVRVPGRGKGKSGGYRVMTLFGGDDIPVYLLAVLSKGTAENFSAAQVKMMAKVVDAILKEAKERKAG